MANVMPLTDLLGTPDFRAPKQIERDVESIVLSHTKRRSGETFPITTDDLTTLLEKHTAELDLYADLSEFGDVEGATFFRANSKPTVKIRAILSDATNENRLRSTLTHEFGHVILHDPMFQRHAQDGLFDSPKPVLQVSFRDGFSPGADLFEFQAWSVCGALLMPVTELNRIMGGMASAANHYSDIYLYDDLGVRIHDFVTKRFSVSKDLARVRLLKAGIVTDKKPAPALF